MKKVASVKATPRLTADRYWKLRAQLRDFSQAKADAERGLENLQAGIAQTMREAGLDPAITYHLSDVDCTATPHGGAS